MKLTRRIFRAKLRQLALVLVTTATLALSGCDDAVPLTKLQPGDTIVAFGDSLTFGKGVSNTAAYPAVLQNLSGHTVVNAGISGETTAQGANRLSSVLNAHNPALVILFEGGNDVLRNLDKSETKANLDKMILETQAFGAQVVLVAVPEKSLFSSAAPWYKELADQHGLLLQGDIVAKLIKKPAMKSDSVHFNAAGYKALAEAIHTMLKDNGAY